MADLRIEGQPPVSPVDRASTQTPTIDFVEALAAAYQQRFGSEAMPERVLCHPLVHRSLIREITATMPQGLEQLRYGQRTSYGYHEWPVTEWHSPFGVFEIEKDSTLPEHGLILDWESHRSKVKQ